MLQQLRAELEGYQKDLGRLRAYIDRANIRLEKDEEMCRLLHHNAKAAAAAEQASNLAAAKAARKAGVDTAAADAGSEDTSPIKDGAAASASASAPNTTVSAAQQQEAAMMAATDAKALEIDQYKQQFLVLVHKYYYLFDLIRMLETDGKELLLQKRVPDDGAGGVFGSAAATGGGGRVGAVGHNFSAAAISDVGSPRSMAKKHAVRWRWVRRELTLVDVSVHACHLYIPPSEDEGNGLGHHHHHHHHHSHQRGEPPPLSPHLTPKRDEVGRTVLMSHSLRLLEEESVLSCRRLGVPMAPCADIIANLTYYQLSHGISSNEYALKMYRHHVDRFSGKINSRPFVANQAETEAAEVEAAVDEDIAEMLMSAVKDSAAPDGFDEYGLIYGDEKDVGLFSGRDSSSRHPQQLRSAALSGKNGGLSAASIENMTAEGVHTSPYHTVMGKCASSLKYIWAKDGLSDGGAGGATSPEPALTPAEKMPAFSPCVPSQRPDSAGYLAEIDNEDPYLLPISHFNNNVSQYVQYPLLQGHTVLSSSHLLRSERVRCNTCVNFSTVREQIEFMLAQQDAAKAWAHGEGAFAVSPLGREFAGLSADPSVGVSTENGNAEQPPVLHKIPPPMTHIDPQRVRKFQSHGSGSHLHTLTSHTYNEVVIYKMTTEPPAKFIQHQLQRILGHEYDLKMGKLVSLMCVYKSTVMTE